MPGGDGEGIFYSFNMGRAHIIGISTEIYYYPEYGTAQIQTQFNWLVNDLKVTQHRAYKSPTIRT